jgi:hypothetical protein
MSADLDRATIRQEMDQARQDFHHLLSHATTAHLRLPSDGTSGTTSNCRSTLVFGYLVTRALLVLARAFGLLPGCASKAVGVGCCPWRRVRAAV